MDVVTTITRIKTNISIAELTLKMLYKLDPHYRPSLVLYYHKHH